MYVVVVFTPYCVLSNDSVPVPTNVLQVSNVVNLIPGQGSTQGTLTASASATFSVTGCNVLPNIGLSNMQQWAAVTWAWTAQKIATPSSYQATPGGGVSPTYTVTLTRTRTTGTYWLSGTLTINNPASYPMYISSVSLTSTAGQFGQLPTNCIGGSNIGATTAPINNGMGGMPTMPTSGLSGVFLLAAGAQVNCVFNISAGTGSPMTGQVQAMATTYTSAVGSAGNAAYSQPFPINFAAPTQQWDIGGCVTFTDNAVTNGMAGAWSPQLTGLPQQQQICETRTWSYSGSVSAVPPTGATCNVPVAVRFLAVL